MKNKIRVMRPLILLLLVFATLASCVVTAGAIGWSGSSTAGGVASSSSSGGKYSINGETAMQCLVGYRFAAIKADGTLANPKKESLDVFIKERESYLDSGVWARMIPQYSKKRYFNSFGDTNSERLNATEPEYHLDAQSMTGTAGFVKKESQMEFDTDLPGRSTTDLGEAMDAWQNNNKNLKVIAQALGYANGLASMQTNDTITVEPLFAVEVDNEALCLTVAEMANYGGRVFGWDSTGRGGDAGNGKNDNYWGFIARFTNKEYGNTLYNDEELGLGWTIVTTGASERVSFRACIQFGYGVGICYKQKDTRPDLECVEIFFIDKDQKIYADPMQLPASKTIYAIAVYRNNSITKQNANFYAQLNSSSTALASSQMMYATVYKPYSELGMTYMTGDFMKKGGTKISLPMSPGGTCTMVLMQITPNSSGSTGYVHAQTWLKGASSATTGAGETPTSSRPYLESNIANNYKKVQYKFVSNPKQDVGIEVLLTDSKGPFDGKIYSDTEMKKLPYGSVVQVWHKYFTKDADDYPSSVYVNGYDRDSSGIVKVNGSTRILITKGQYTYVLVTAFRANSFSNVTRKGHVYLAGASYGSTLGETNTGNNSDSITWAAKCDVELYQIILQQLDTNGNVVATWTRTQGKPETTPSIPYGAKVRIKYVYRNNSQDVLRVDGYKSQTISTANKFGSNYSINANKSTREVTYGTFTATASGRVYGAVRVNGYTGTGPETNAGNNSLSFGYTVSQPKDLLVTQIRYAYKDHSGKTVTQTVARGSSIVPKFPHGVVVSVYYTFQNSSSIDIWIDGYYTVGTNGTRVKINNSTNNAVNYKLTAKSSKEFYVGNIVTNGKLGDGTYIAEVFQVNSVSASGETDTTNNKQTSTYKVYGDIEVTDIYFTPKDSTTKLSEPVSMAFGTEFDIWVTVKNNTPFAQNIDVWFRHEGASAASKIYTNVSIAANGTKNYKVDSRKVGFGANEFDAKAAAQFTGRTSATGECDVNGVDKSGNNERTETYRTYGDIEVTDIYFTPKGGTTKFSEPPSLEYGTEYDIWVTVKNNTPLAQDIDVWYGHEGEGAAVMVHEKVSIAANGTANYKVDTRSVGVVSDTFTVRAAAQFTGRTSATGETDINGHDKSGNNIRNEDYSTWFYDIAITDIFFEDTEGNVYGKGNNDSTSLLVGKTYNVYYTLTNNSSKVANIGIYLNKVATATNKLTKNVLPLYGGGVISSARGLVLTPGQSISVCVGQSEGANQNIGYAQVSGSVYISNSLNADRETNTANNTLEEQVIFKHNVSIEEVYLTPLGSNQRFPVNSSDPRFVDIPVGTTANVHYVLKNHTGKTIKVNIYTGSTPKIQTVNHGNYVITLNPMETKEVVLDKTLTLNVTGKRMLVGSVYRNGYSPNTDPYEMTFSDNTTNCYYNGVVTPYIVPIIPNAPYREGTDVITSFYLFNPTTKAYNGRPGATAEVRLTVKLKGTTKVIYEENKFTVVPASCSTSDRAQLVYFKWSVPEDYLEDTDKFEVCADLFIPQYPDIGISYVSYSQSYVNKDAKFTPDTKYEDNQPSGWSEPTTRPVNSAASKKWNIWYFENGRFVQRNYGLQAAVTGGLLIKPDDKIVTAYEKQPNHWVMKAGYGVQVESLADCAVYRLTGYALLADDMYTQSQYSYMRWPEFQYSVNYNTPTISTLEKVGGKWMLPIFSNGDKVYGRVHFTPLWYPDGNYTAYACHSDIWTPMGMIAVGVSDFIEIDGTAYDDWYIGHG